MEGFLLVAVYLHHEVPLRVFDDRGQHAAQCEADELEKHPERLLERYRQAHDAIAPDMPEFPVSEDRAPLFFDVLRITNGQVGELVYCTENSAGTDWDSDHD